MPRHFAAMLAPVVALVVAATVPGAGHAATPPPLPAEVRTALRHAGVPESALSVAVHDAASGRPLLVWQAAQPRNPASLAKLVTTFAALERLGPAWRWTTPVWLAGPVRDGVLDGALHIRGSGDPTLVLERVWLLLRRVRELGVREIRGDIVLDDGAFAVPDTAAADFDGEASRPYNVQPAALLLNYRSVIYRFVPDAAAGVARVGVEPPLARTTTERSVPLAAQPCGDWRAAIGAEFDHHGNVRFTGRYPVTCGEQTWARADPQPATFDARLLEGLWREMGGALAGRVRIGPAPADTAATFEVRSPPLPEVVRDINKFSNNVMAEQLALTLAREAAPDEPATPQAARALLGRWLVERVSGPPSLADDEIDLRNGSGLTRDTRLSARVLARLLLAAWASPLMPELVSSLPVAGVDGTLRRARAASGRAHLKTGSLRDVAAIAGYVLGPRERRLVLVAIVNHPQASAARPALEALLDWSAGTAADSTGARP